MKLEENHKEKSGKTTNTRRLNNMLLNNEWFNQEIKKEIKKYMEIKGNENTIVQNHWDCKSSSKKEVYSNIVLPQEARKISNNLILHLKELAKEQQTKPKASRRKEIIKIRTETKDIENKNTIEHISETMRWFFEKNQ